MGLQDGKDEQGFPTTFEPGLYNFSFHVCQGECGSSHPHSKDFGRVMGTFNMTGAAPGPSPSPTPAPDCMSQMDEKSCESTSDITGEACQWCEFLHMPGLRHAMHAGNCCLNHERFTPFLCKLHDLMINGWSIVGCMEPLL